MVRQASIARFLDIVTKLQNIHCIFIVYLFHFFLECFKDQELKIIVLSFDIYIIKLSVDILT